VERAAAERELWFQVARESWDAYEQHQPHHLPGLSQIAQLLDLASSLGASPPGSRRSTSLIRIRSNRI
jgi:hypothetical protein